MAINSKIIFCKGIKMDKDNRNVLTYSENDMLTLVNTTGIKIAEASNYSFIGKGDRDAIDVSLDLNLTYQVLLQCNYIAFQNTNYCNKWYFAFVNKIQYLNNGAARIFYTVDIFHTWYDYWTAKSCFVIREHVNDDTVGLHTIPEGLETGEYICNAKDYYDGFDDMCYVIQCTEWSSGDNPPLATNFGGVYMAGGAYYTDNIEVFVNILQSFATAGRSDAIYNCYMIPKLLINYPIGTITNNQYPGQSIPVTDYKVITKPTTLDSYSPVNNKLKTFPYMYLVVSNNNGSSNIFHYERFHEQEYLGHCDFEIKGVPTVGGSVKINPLDYDNGYKEENGLIGGKFPTLNWSEDSYTNWLTQNSVNLSLGVISSGLTILGGIGMMSAGAGVSGASSMVSGALSIASQMGQVYEHSLMQHSAKGNTNGGDINVCSQCNGFYFYKMSIKSEFAASIDNYFSKYGYKINRLKLPNQTGRTTFNYVQIGGGEIIGYQKDSVLAIPPADLVKINNLYERGITLWHNYSTLGDYTQSNTIVS
jgi:hypothetical protein